MGWVRSCEGRREVSSLSLWQQGPQHGDARASRRRGGSQRWHSPSTAGFGHSPSTPPTSQRVDESTTSSQPPLVHISFRQRHSRLWVSLREPHRPAVHTGIVKAKFARSRAPSARQLQPPVRAQVMDPQSVSRAHSGTKVSGLPVSAGPVSGGPESMGPVSGDPVSRGIASGASVPTSRMLASGVVHLPLAQLAGHAASSGTPKSTTNVSPASRRGSVSVVHPAANHSQSLSRARAEKAYVPGARTPGLGGVPEASNSAR